MTTMEEAFLDLALVSLAVFNIYIQDLNINVGMPMSS